MPCFPCLDTESTGLSRARNRLYEVTGSNSIPSPLRRTLNLRHNRLDDLRRCYGISLADRTRHGALILNSRSHRSVGL